MRYIYNKLVRDEIPSIIAQAGKRCATEVLDAPSYRQALLDKLREEVQELLEAAQQAEPAPLLTELADVQEVLDSLCRVYGFSLAQLQTLQVERRKVRGGFEQQIKLLWVEEEAESADSALPPSGEGNDVTHPN